MSKTQQLKMLSTWTRKLIHGLDRRGNRRGDRGVVSAQEQYFGLGPSDSAVGDDESVNLIDASRIRAVAVGVLQISRFAIDGSVLIEFLI